MGEIIYWKQYDKPKPFSHTFSYVNQNEERKQWTDSGETKGEFVCSDERVEKFWITAQSTGDKSKFIINGHLIMKDGNRWNSTDSIILTSDQDLGGNIECLISQAEQYLRELK